MLLSLLVLCGNGPAVVRQVVEDEDEGGEVIVFHVEESIGPILGRSLPGLTSQQRITPYVDGI